MPDYGPEGQEWLGTSSWEEADAIVAELQKQGIDAEAPRRGTTPGFEYWWESPEQFQKAQEIERQFHQNRTSCMKLSSDHTKVAAPERPGPGDTFLVKMLVRVDEHAMGGTDILERRIRDALDNPPVLVVDKIDISQGQEVRSFPHGHHSIYQ